MTRDQELWGMALAIEKEHGDDAAQHIANEINRMYEEGSDDGMDLWLDVMVRLFKLGRKPQEESRLS